MARVLVVDDEFGILRLLEDVFSDEGHSVELAVNGKQALERIEDQRPDIVLTDFMMPVMDGAELIKSIRASEALSDIPVVVMSSLTEASVAERCTGYQRFVRKPFKIFELIQIVSQLVEAADKK